MRASHASRALHQARATVRRAAALASFAVLPSTAAGPACFVRMAACKAAVAAVTIYTHTQGRDEGSGEEWRIIEAWMMDDDDGE